MKRLTIIITAFVLALLMAGILPAQVFADSVPEYISEVKIGMGKETADAEKALAGYTILSDSKGNPVDLNQKAGGGFGSKGEKVVYLGYKTTSDRKNAITDLALMNMKGGYSVQDYEALMDLQMKSQIIPFADRFITTLEEYRLNSESENEINKARADYYRSLLNKLIDSDTGKPLGDLLLNETKYEMGLKAYNSLTDAEKENTDVIKESDKVFDSLSDSEKKDHADIITILAQANGQATILMESLLTRAADTGDESWIDRLAGITYDNLIDAVEGLPTDAAQTLARMYDSDARRILEKWELFSEALNDYDSNLKVINNFELNDDEDSEEKYDNFELETAETDEIVDLMLDTVADREEALSVSETAGAVAVADYLEDYEYGDGTLLDFFRQTREEAEENIEMLYPVVAALSPGQLAGLDFVSLQDLVMTAEFDPEELEDAAINDTEPVSIYDGVDRGIYEKGGVALTSDALRADAAASQAQEFPGLSILTGIMIGVSAATSVGFIAAVIARGRLIDSYRTLQRQIQVLTELSNTSTVRMNAIGAKINKMSSFGIRKSVDTVPKNVSAASDEFLALRKGIESNNKLISTLREKAASTRFQAKALMTGVTVALVIITAITTFLAYRDLVNHYKVEFTPIPRYMVDEKDITVYNEFGEKTVLKNQTAYYRAVECNRTSDDEMFNNLSTCADMNGDVGKQWLALYEQRSDTSSPVIADSLMVKVNDNNVPAGYTTGIHMFGSSAAFNLNNELYDWNKDAPGVYVYFKTDTSAKPANATGSTFSSGALALTGGAGLGIGAFVSALAVKAAGKKRKSEA